MFWENACATVIFLGSPCFNVVSGPCFEESGS